MILFNFGPKSSTLLIFFFHGLVYAGLLWKKGREHSNRSSQLLSIFILLCCFYICPWMLGHAGWYARQPYRDIMFYIPFQQLFFLGPIIYLYTQSLLNKSFEFTKRDWLHFVPGICYLIYSLIVWITDKWVIGAYYFYEDERDKDLSMWYQIAGIVSMVFYFVLSLRYYYSYKKLAFQVISFAEGMLFSWMKKFLLVFLAMQLARILFLLLYPNWGSFGVKFWYYLIFSILFYYVAITGYSNTVQAMIPFKLSLFGNKLAYLVEEEDQAIEIDLLSEVEAPSETVQKPELSEELQCWKDKIQQLMEKEALYLDPQLSLTDLAQRLSTNSRIISQTINKGFSMNFNDFVNHYRVEAVKQKFEEDSHQQMTLLGVALACGFNSKATFNRAFKKHTSRSPKNYLADLNLA